MSYAAVVSLKHTLKLVLDDSSRYSDFPRNLLLNIYNEACYLQSFLETINSLLSSKRLDDLENRIKDLALKAEDLIESLIFECKSSYGERFPSAFSDNLFIVKQEISSFTKTLKMEEHNETEDQPESRSFASNAGSSRIDSGGRNKMDVGYVTEQIQLLGWLVLHIPRLDVASIVGMAGIGKTTLLREVFYDSFVADHFQRRIFLSVGPTFILREVLLLFLGQLGFTTHERHLEETNELGKFLRTSLIGRRYLIVLDDVWNGKVWDELKEYFPDNNNGSRIIVTTRLADVAPRIHENRCILEMPFLNDDESWKLLKKIVFTDGERCDPELEKIGKEIAKKCEGLPLAIIAVGKELLKIEKTVENWTMAEQDDDLLVIRTDDDTPISKSLTLSYKELPQHLKPCFLYMGVFPKEYKIHTSKLVNLWVTERFIEPEKSKSLEETAEGLLDNLISKRLVVVSEQSSTGRIKACRLHFVFRILTASEARSEKFYHVMKKANSCPKGTDKQRRLCIHNNVVLSIKEVLSSMESVSPMHSLLCFGPSSPYPLPVEIHYGYLRVLDVLAIRFYNFPNEVLQLVLLKYLAITYDGDHPESISRLRNLEVLVVRRYWNIKFSYSPVYLPIEIWNLHKLKHLYCMGFDLPYPSVSYKFGCLEKLLTLSGVSFHSCKPRVLAGMPNLMKLRVRIESNFDEVKIFTHFGDFTNLHHLESFKCVVAIPSVGSPVGFSFPTFPDNLRKITLSGCGYSWDYVAYIGRLPNLEVLKLRCYSFCGPEWFTIEGEFCKLKYLLLEDLNIERWEVASTEHFPKLSRLIIRHCYKLKYIPHGVEGTETIELVDCSPSLVISAQQLYERRHDWVNDYVHLQIQCSWNEKNHRSW